MIRRCPACSEEISVLASTCKYCGESVEATRLEPVTAAAEPPKRKRRCWFSRCCGKSEEAVEVRGPRPDIEFIEEPAATIAWEQPRRGVLSRWWGTFREANFSPANFFAKMPRTGGFSKPIGFAYGLFLQMAFIGVIVASLVGLGAAVHGAPVTQHDTFVGLAIVIGVLAGGYLATAGALFVGSAFWHVVAKIFGGTGTYESTFRVVSYSVSAQGWTLLPYVGGFINALMNFVLLYHGFREVHQLSKGRALAAVILPFVAMLGLVFVAICCIAAGGCAAGCC
jgi:hypothetical protein